MEKQATVSFLHAGSIGDVWAALPAVRENCRKYKKKAILYLQNERDTWYYEGAVHPTVNAEGKMVMLNKKMIDMMIPLLMAQPYIQLAKMWESEPINCNLNEIRETNVGMPNFCISRWYFYKWPDLTCDLSEKWLTVPDSKKNLAKDKIIITRTERYTHPDISYNFLQKYQKDILFCGTDLEFVIFQHRFNLLKIGRLEINNFLELAQALKQCKFHISNQTQAFQLSQGLKIPRIVELCKFAPNVIAVGKNAHDTLSQDGMEYAFHKLHGLEKEYLKVQKEKFDAAMKKKKLTEESFVTLKIPTQPKV